MSEKHKDGGAAYPMSFTSGAFQHGMSLRDYFAGQALAGMTLKHDGDYSQADIKEGRTKRESTWRATAAYRMADAMLAERDRL